MNRKADIGITALCLMLGMGCASSSKSQRAGAPVYVADKVVGRSEFLSKSPDWVSETVSVKENGDHYDIIGVAEVLATAASRLHFTCPMPRARRNLAAKIETNLTRVVQTTESGFSMDDQQLLSLIKEVSQVSLQRPGYR